MLIAYTLEYQFVSIKLYQFLNYNITDTIRWFEGNLKS